MTSKSFTIDLVHLIHKILRVGLGTFHETKADL